MTTGPGERTDGPRGALRLARLFSRRAAVRSGTGGRGLLAGLRIRKKLIVLHTVFSLGLLLLLIVGLRPAVTEVVDRAETGEAKALLTVLSAGFTGNAGFSPEAGEAMVRGMEGVSYGRGSAADLGLDPAIAEAAAGGPGVPVVFSAGRAGTLAGLGEAGAVGGGAVMAVPGPGGAGRPGEFAVVTVEGREARAAVTRLYLLAVFALVGVYIFIAVALELFVLPQSVYAPIERMLDADRALREGRADKEMIPEAQIPADEIGEIMRSRNESVAALRTQEAELARALTTLEAAANDLKLKNHLLETARRNLADADRLVSLGMMSAGLAHELNTPLAVLKGLVERLNKNPDAGMDAPSAALMLRVVGRLERLGESLLDFARVRPHTSRPTPLREVVEEAVTLVRLERGGAASRVDNLVPADLTVECDADRIVQVMVNLVRNARNAIAEGSTLFSGEGRIEVAASASDRDGRSWVSITVRDNGPGIDPALLPRLFEPFATTRLDARGTGLGLAVAEGIVREHGGVILARNRGPAQGPHAPPQAPSSAPAAAHPPTGGAEFEVLLPRTAVPAPGVVSSATE